MKNLTFIIRKYFQAFLDLPNEVITFSILTILAVFCLLIFVPLTPTVDDNFFFSSDDPQFKSEHLIDDLFLRKDSQLIISAKGNINDKNYRDKVAELSEALLEQVIFIVLYKLYF